MLNKEKTAVLYARVSTTEQKDNGYSLPQQKDLLYDYCERNNITVLGYFEEDYTGTTLDRPKIKLLKEFVSQNEVDLVLFHKWDRFSRKTLQGLVEIEKFQSLGVEVNSLIERIDFNIPQQQIMLLMYLGLGEVENTVRSQRTKNGIIGALKEGRHVNKAPIGYINARDPENTDKPLIAPCPDKAPLIKRIFEEYATGLYSQESLRKKYHKLGIKRSKSQFSNLLSNVIYKGIIKIPEHNGEPSMTVIALHKPLISETLFHKVQKVKNGKSNVRLNTKTKSIHDSKLPLRGGILQCRQCGRNMTGSRSKSRNGDYHYYYHCNSRKGCNERFRVNLAHDALLAEFENLKPCKAVLRLFKEILIDEYEKLRKHFKNDMKQLTKKLAEYEAKLDSLTMKYVEGDLDKEIYNRLKTKLSDEANDLKTEIEFIPSTDKNIERYLEFGLSLLTNLNEFYFQANAVVKRKILGSILSENLVFETNKYRTIKFTEAINLIFNYNKGLQEVVNKKGDPISKVSYSVAGTGFKRTQKHYFQKLHQSVN